MEAGDPGGVDEPVDHDGGDDLPAQPVLFDRVGVALPEGRWEVVDQAIGQVGIVGQLRGQHLGRQHDLGVRHQDSQLRSGEAAAVAPPNLHLLGAGKELDVAVEELAVRQAFHPVLVDPGHRGGLEHAVGQGEVLVVVVGEHQLGDLVRHGGQQLVPVLARQSPGRYLAGEQDLDVDLVVGGVDARRSCR